LLRTSSAEERIEIVATTCTVQRQQQQQTFSHVVADIEPTSAGRKARVRFGIDGLSARQPWEVQLERFRHQQPPHTIVTFHTGGEQLPLAALGVLFPFLEEVGSEATWQGEWRLIQCGREQLMELSGNVGQLDLEPLAQRWLPHHRLSGMAEVRLAALQLHNGTIALAKGEVRSQQGGEIGPALLDALGQKLNLAPPQPPRLPHAGRIRYSHLAFAFQLDSAGLALSGDADPASSGVVMASAAAGPLLVESSQAVLPVACLADALSPPARHTIPATPEARSWIELLPAPALLPAEPAEPVRQAVPLRLRPAGKTGPY
jgi:hypothetical protein